MKKGILRLLTIALAMSFVLSGCKKDDDNDDNKVKLKGFYITNEGQFQKGNGSISFYDKEKDKVINEVFKNANGGTPLGDVVQSMTIVNDKAVICVNGSNKVVIANSTDMKQIYQIESIKQPRYALKLDDNTVLVSAWGNNGEVHVVSLTSNTVTKTIQVGAGAERMVKSGDFVYVANSGGYADSKTVSVIDTKTFTVVKTVDTECFAPIALVKTNDKIAVLCKGKTLYDSSWNTIGNEPSYLVMIDASSNTVAAKIKLYDDKHPANLHLSNDGTKFLIGGGFGFTGVFEMGVTSTSISTSALINKDFYGFNVNPENGNIIGFTNSNGGAAKMLRYNPNGTLIKEYDLGFFANNIASEKRK
jgi:YVTN family beta-propeller protein